MYTGIVALVILILDIIAIVSVLGGGGSAMYKLVWILLILFLPIIGMVLYFLLGKQAA
jgi:hypothetical protein